jgi:predicted PurR-regulated permease PerM
MDITHKEIRQFVVIFMIFLMAVLAFLLLRPILISLIGGLILAYLFFPVHRFLLGTVKEKNVSAGLVSLVAVLVIFVPLWFLLQIITPQIFQLFTSAQSIDLSGFMKAAFPKATDQFITQVSLSIQNGVTKTLGSLFDSVVQSSFNNLPEVLLQLFVVGTVFFFGLRDGDKLSGFISSISPLNKTQEALITKHFKNITDSVIYGNIIVGIIQGLFAGIGFLIFGIPHVALLTVIAIIFGILPVLGPIMVWAPLTIFLLANGQVSEAIGFLIYNAILVSGFENILRPYIVSRKTDVPTSIIFIGMIGGTMIFGFIGLLIGPLVLAYLLEILRAYRNKSISTLFTD